METYTNLYPEIYSMGNLTLAWRKARKGKTTKHDIVAFEQDIAKNLLNLHNELKNKTYKPRELHNFILRDPKTRKISKSDFRDRIIHHAIINVIGNVFERGFIYDSCANQKNKGSSFALKRFDKFVRKSGNKCCLKADIKHYFQEVDHNVLLEIISYRIKDEMVLWLINQVLKANFLNAERERESNIKGMPLGNYTSQFFANIYLNELDYFVKHTLRVKCYIRYVDDFILFNSSREQLEKWKIEIDSFLRDKLKLELHPQKSRIISLSNGVDFVGFRNFHYYKLLRKRNIRNMRRKIDLFRKGEIGFKEIIEIYQGWQAYAKWGNTFKLREKIKMEIIDAILERV